MLVKMKPHTWRYQLLLSLVEEYFSGGGSEFRNFLWMARVRFVSVVTDWEWKSWKDSVKANSVKMKKNRMPCCPQFCGSSSHQYCFNEKSFSYLLAFSLLFRMKLSLLLITKRSLPSELTQWLCRRARLTFISPFGHQNNSAVGFSHMFMMQHGSGSVRWCAPTPSVFRNETPSSVPLGIFVFSQTL